MITAERCPAERASVYTVRCDNCRTWRQVQLMDPVAGDVYVTHSDLRHRVGFTRFSSVDLCRDCYGKTVGDEERICPRCAWAEEDCVCTPAISSSWDVSNGDVTRAKLDDVCRDEAKAAVEWLLQRKRDSRDRLRAAMAGMANVMRGAFAAAREFAYDTSAYEQLQRDDCARSPGTWINRASAEWSRRVREGVARIKPPGPVVRCQGEED